MASSKLVKQGALHLGAGQAGQFLLNLTTQQALELI